MTFHITDQIAGSQAIADTDATQKHPLGTIVRAVDPTYGEGEFIYLLGVASTTVGALVTYNALTWQTALATSAVGTANPHAVAMSANVASQYGWYQIGGYAVVSKAAGTSFAAGAALASSSGEAIAAATTNRLAGAIVATVASAKSDVLTVGVMISRPAGPSSD